MRDIARHDQGVDQRDAAVESHVRARRRYPELVHRALHRSAERSGSHHERVADEIDEIVPRKQGLWRLRVFEESAKVEIGHGASPVCAIRGQIAVDSALVRNRSACSCQRQVDAEIDRLTRDSHRPIVIPAKRNVGVRVRERGHVERSAEQVEVVRHVLVVRRYPAAAGDARYGKICVVMNQISVGESNIEPERVETRRSGYRSLESEECGTERLHRSQVECLEIYVECMKYRERGLIDIHAASRRELRYRSGNVRVRERELRVVDPESVERATPGTDVTRELPVPRKRKRLSVEDPDELEIERRRSKVHVLEHQHRPAHAVRHVTHEVRRCRADVHVLHRVVHHPRMAHVVDEQLETSPARCRKCRIDPCDVVERDLIADDVNVVAHGNPAAPYELARWNSSFRSRELEPRRIEPDGIGDMPDVDRDVFYRERRILYIE